MIHGGKSLNDKGQIFCLLLRSRHYHLLDQLRFSDQQEELIRGAV